MFPFWYTGVLQIHTSSTAVVTVSTFFRLEFSSDLSCLLFVFSAAQDVFCTSKCLQYTSSLLRICGELLKVTFPDQLLEALGIATRSFKANEQAVLPLVGNVESRVVFIILSLLGRSVYMLF